MHLFLKSAVARMHSPSRRPKVLCRCLRCVECGCGPLCSARDAGMPNNSVNVSVQSSSFRVEVGRIRHDVVVTTRRSRRHLHTPAPRTDFVGSGASDSAIAAGITANSRSRTARLERTRHRLSVGWGFVTSRLRRRWEGVNGVWAGVGCALRSFV